MDMIEIRQGFYERDGFSLSIDFAVAVNSVVAVIGPSGAGKSTLLNIIAGFEPLQSGSIFLDSIEHHSTQPAFRPVNLVFQDNNSFAHLTARDNVGLGINPMLRLSTDDWNVVDNALLHVGIGHLAHRKPTNMSGGERQRIALARVLVLQKPILLLDEAFAALGPALRQDMLMLVKQIQVERALTVLMVTHEPDDAKHIAHHVMFVDRGVVRPPQNVNTFFTSKDAAVQQYLGTSPP